MKQTLNILIAEDDDATRLLLRHTLENTGYNVTPVGNGRLARLQLMSNEQYDLVYSDFFMPEMTGLELFAWLRHHPTRATTPFILSHQWQRLQSKSAISAPGPIDFLQNRLITAIFYGLYNRCWNSKSV